MLIDYIGFGDFGNIHNINLANIITVKASMFVMLSHLNYSSGQHEILHAYVVKGTEKAKGYPFFS